MLIYSNPYPLETGYEKIYVTFPSFFIDSPFFVQGSEETSLAVAQGNSLAKRIGTKQEDEGSGSFGELGGLKAVKTPRSLTYIGRNEKLYRQKPRKEGSRIVFQSHHLSGFHFRGVR